MSERAGEGPSGMTDADMAALDAEPMCVGRAVGIDGRDLTAWVIPSMTWRGHLRWTPKVERYFVCWRTFWWGRRCRSFDTAKAKALAVLARIDAKQGRQDP